MSNTCETVLSNGLYHKTRSIFMYAVNNAGLHEDY